MRRIGLDRARDVALHEQPLAVVERRQLVVARAQRGHLSAHAEKRAHEILERTRQLDQQVGLVLGRQLLRRGPRRHQLAHAVSTLTSFSQRHESRVETGKTVAVVQVGEVEAVAPSAGAFIARISRRPRGDSFVGEPINHGRGPSARHRARTFATFMHDDGAARFTHGPAAMQPAPAPVRNWLIVVAAMIFFMIVLGALTRLTESGLSMVEWRPVTGWLPPLVDGGLAGRIAEISFLAAGTIDQSRFQTSPSSSRSSGLSSSTGCGAG